MKREITDNIRNPVVMIIIAIILIAVLICSMVFTYAAASTPGGYSSETKSGRYGYKNGYFYVHFYKNNSCYKSVKISTEAQTEVTGATALYTELTRNASKYAVSSSDQDFIQITSTPVTSRRDPITGSVQEIYCFTRINSKILCPRGYKHSSTVINKDSNNDQWTIRPYIRNSDGTYSRFTCGTHDADTFISSVWAVALQGCGNITRTTDGQYYRDWHSVDIKFTPNRTAITFDANGGAGTMENQTVTYDAGEKLDLNLYTREGYIFSQWNTEIDGSGKAFEDEAAVSEAFPVETSVTLYAQWEAVPAEHNSYHLSFGI